MLVHGVGVCTFGLAGALAVGRSTLRLAVALASFTTLGIAEAGGWLSTLASTFLLLLAP